MFPSVHALLQLASIMLTPVAFVATPLLDTARNHIHTLRLASSSAVLDKGIGSGEVEALHSLLVMHLLLLPEQCRSLLV